MEVEVWCGGKVGGEGGCVQLVSLRVELNKDDADSFNRFRLAASNAITPQCHFFFYFQKSERSDRGIWLLF